MTATDIAMMASAAANVALAWAALTARARMSEAETRAYFYRKQARDMAKAFAITQRNSVQRDPKTGRYMKKGTRA